MYEVTQKILKMRLEEFKNYEVPKGWKLLHMSGHIVYPVISMIPGYDTSPYFQVSITIEKE